MELKRTLTGLVAGLLIAPTPVKGETNLAIVDFRGGLLTWTNVDPLLYYSVEWLPSLTDTNAWTDSHRSSQDIQSTDPTITVPVPMFYRVVGRTSPAHTRVLAPGTTAVESGYYEATNLTQVDPNLSSANIRSGASIFGVTGNSQVVNTASGDAQAGELLEGRKAWVGGAEVTGSMPNRGSMIITPGTATQSIPFGYHFGTGTVPGDADLIPGNIRSGANIFGVAGASEVVNTATGDAQAGEVLAGKKAWVDGAEVTGSMPNRGAVVITPGTAQQAIQAGYHNGAGYVRGDAGLVASNIVAGVDVFGVVGLHGQYHADSFPAVNTSLWTTFDPGTAGVGTDPKGFHSAVFDGRYVYFVPIWRTGNVYHGEVLRLDTQTDFGSTNAWSAFDPGDHGVGTDPDGYAGGVFDGRYVYFAPIHNGTDYHGEVLRLDTQADFNTTDAWTTYTPHSYGVGVHGRGYNGAVFDGRFVYFVPSSDGVAHGEVLRYDTQSAFDTTNSWAAYDPGDHGVGTDPDGYAGGVFDGRYLYFVPNNNGAIYHSEVLRFDTQSAFDAVGSWTTFDPTANGVPSGRGYYGGVFDGRYVYFIPLVNNGPSYHGLFVRYDTQGDFGTAGSWAAYDPGAAGVGSDPDGYLGGIFDGRYIYFSPYYNGSAFSGEVLRFDVRGTFDAKESWSSYIPYLNGISSTARGFRSGAFDGRYIYFAPYNNNSAYSGEVLRLDAKNPPEVPATVSGGSFF